MSKSKKKLLCLALTLTHPRSFAALRTWMRRGGDTAPYLNGVGRILRPDAHPASPGPGGRAPGAGRPDPARARRRHGAGRRADGAPLSLSKGPGQTPGSTYEDAVPAAAARSR